MCTKQSNASLRKLKRAIRKARRDERAALRFVQVVGIPPIDATLHTLEELEDRQFYLEQVRELHGKHLEEGNLAIPHDEVFARRVLAVENNMLP